MPVKQRSAEGRSGATTLPTGAPPPNAFIGKASAPTNADLAEALGPVLPVWERLINELASEHGVSDQEWSSYSRKAGWSLRVKAGKRTILWMTPCLGSFRVAFILGDKAVQAAHNAGLSSATIRMIDEAQKFAEGTGLRLSVKGPKDLAQVRKLAAVKLAH